MDDEEIVADIARQMLDFLGYEVTVVSNGEEAVAQYQQALDADIPYSLVIMDLNIPGGMGGIDAVKEVLDCDADAKVLVSSGYSNDQIMMEYGAYGFAGCIAKPFDLEGLKSIVERVLA